MKEVLKFDIKSNGALSALPYLVFWLFITLSGIIGDKMVQKMEKTTVRKIFNSLGKHSQQLLVVEEEE
jgi:MFS transporter, ACS family, solute carrier family 17 (sodium-dependent inorganic phosphate cotransporter), member 5